MSLNVGDKNAKITVLLMNKAGDMIIDRTDLQLKDGLLPIRELKNKWNANVWLKLVVIQVKFIRNKTISTKFSFMQVFYLYSAF